MKYRVEAWTTLEDEGTSKEVMVEWAEFEFGRDGTEEATEWLWERLNEGFAVRLYRV